MYTNKLINNYSIIINSLILINNHYNGKYKTQLNKNFNTIMRMIILIEEIQIILFQKKNISEFFEKIEILNMDDYELIDIDNEYFFYHLNMNDYKKYVELFEYLKKIFRCIQNFCFQIKIINSEIKDKIFKIQKSNNIKKSSKSSSSDYYKKTLETFIIKKSRSISKKDIINEIISYLLNLKKRNNNKLLEINKKFHENNIYIYDDDIDDMKVKLNKENITKLNEIKSIILSIYMKLSSGRKDEDIINEIIYKLVLIHLNEIIIEIKKIISLNYKKISNSKTEENIIIEIIIKIIETTDAVNRIAEIKKILDKNYISSNSINDNVYLIIRLILGIKENKKIIIRDIKNELNINKIFILDKYLKENDYKILILNIEEIKNKLREYETDKIKKINKIISKIKIDDTSDLMILNKYYNLINSWDNIFIYDIDKIFYMINETNEIKRDIEKTNLLDQNIKDLILNNIVYYSYDIEDKITLEISKFIIPIEKSKNDINKFNINHIKDIIKIIELYHKLVSNNLTDKKIMEIITEILRYNNHNEYEYLLKEFTIINLYYKFDYNFIIFDSDDTFKIYLEKLYIYKNYIYIIRNLYIFLLSIKDNFNLLFSTIEKIKTKLELYKKVDSSLKENLLNKLNMVNEDKNNGIIFNNLRQIEEYINKLIYKNSK